MTWLSVNLSLPSAQAEEFSDSVLESGAIAVDIDHEGEPVDLSVLFRPESDIAQALDDAARLSGIVSLPAYSTSLIADQDWVKLTQSQFKPIQIAPKLNIVPTWSEPPDRDAINVRLDPGLAFGTGSHPTTQLCLRWLSRVICGRETVVDYGCGSGILAIAALKLGASRAAGIDNDINAVAVSRDNASRNNVGADFYLPQQCPELEADIVVANILLQPLVDLAPRLAALTRPSGRIALAGMLERESEELKRAYREWFAIDLEGVDEGWALVAGMRR